MEQQTKEWVEQTLERVDMVEWDRFVEGHDPNVLGSYVVAYGWIERKNDNYKDFVIVTFYADTARRLYEYTTSSDEWTEAIHRRLYDEPLENHNACQRVEEHLDVGNAIEL